MAEKQHAQMEMSMTLESAINLLRSRDDCVVLPPSGVPVVGPRLKLPPGKRGQGETGSVCNCLTELAQLRGTRKKMPQKKDATEKRCHRKKMPGMNGTHLRPSVVDYCEGKPTGFSRL
jgi:hypothetical protein